MTDLRNPHAPVPALSAAQRSFVEAAEARGATAPRTACLLSDLPRLATSELDDLVDRGLVREAADWRYYVFRPRRALASVPPVADLPPSVVAQQTRARIVRTVIFWLVALLIPVLFLQLADR